VAADAQAQAIGELLSWLEKQLREMREQQNQAQAQLDQVRRQVHGLSEQMDGAERAAREIEPRLSPFKHLPEKLREIEEDAEHIRHSIAANHTEIEASLRILQAEAEYDRGERAEAYKRIQAAAAQIAVVAANVSQVQQQTAQAVQTVQTLVERQREVEQLVEQFGLRVDRVVEVNKDLEERIRAELVGEQDERFDLVLERLQVVGEMVKRNEDMIVAATAEQTLREEVLQEISVWREEHSRIDSRIATLEGAIEGILKKADELHGQIVLLEGRHTGQGERVAGIRRELSEIVDHVRDEFAKYNALLEKHRRKQIQVLEQELRELKFHAFRPPEEP
jgi:methyl-accepting chemotaxis protein